MTRMAHWVETVPAFVLLSVVLFLPGWIVVRALGARGLEALAVSPAVSVGVIAVFATVAQRVGIRWGLLPLVVVTLLAAGVAWLAVRLLGRHDAELGTARRLLGRPRPDAVAAIAIGIGLALVTIVPAIGRPDELVDSPDAVYHLDRIRLFLETGNFSIANPTFYPNGFHAWIATSLLPGVAGVLPGTNVATLVLAAVVWPIGCVALVRHALGTSRLVTYAAGFASAAFIAFPTILLGWGVLWPNLMATALTPGALALMLQAARSRRLGQWLGFGAAMPGLALIQPNALVALVLFALVWFVAARLRAGLLHHLSWWVVARDLAIVGAVCVVGLVAAPTVSARLASTQSYEWKDRVSIGTALVEVVGGRLQIADVLWGLAALIALGIAWIALRARAALPVVAMWAACVVLYVMAASSTQSWTALVTGYWYNDKVRLASLAAVPGVVLVAAAAPAVRAVLRRVPVLAARPVAVGVVSVLVIPLLTLGLNGATRDRMLTGFFSAGRPEEGHPLLRGAGLAASPRGPHPGRPGRRRPPGERLAAHVRPLRNEHALPLDPDPHDRRRDRHRHRVRRHGLPSRRVRGDGPPRHPLGHRLDPRLLARPAGAVVGPVGPGPRRRRRSGRDRRGLHPLPRHRLLTCSGARRNCKDRRMTSRPSTPSSPATERRPSTPGGAAARHPDWWRTAVVYQIYPRSFADSDGDGVGDLPGITSRLDYLAGLGVDVLWLSPVYRSPMDDNGYDISDYEDVDPLFGTLADLDALIAGVPRAGHCGSSWTSSSTTPPTSTRGSSSHATRARPSATGTGGGPPGPGHEPGTPGAEPNNWGAAFSGPAWHLDEASGEYYLHLFSPKQPDLNWENPEVRQAVYAMMRWWVERGVDGFRMDVINFISKDVALPDGPQGPGQPHGSAFPGSANGPRLDEFLAEMNREVGLTAQHLLTVGEMPGSTIEVARRVTDPAAVRAQHGLHLRARRPRRRPGRCEVGPRRPAPAGAQAQPRVVAGRDSPTSAGTRSTGTTTTSPEPCRASATTVSEHRVHSAKTLATVLHLHRGTPYVYQGEELGMTNAGFVDDRALPRHRVGQLPRRCPGARASTPRPCCGRCRSRAATTPARRCSGTTRRHGGFTIGRALAASQPQPQRRSTPLRHRRIRDSVFAHYQALIALRHTQPRRVAGRASSCCCPTTSSSGSSPAPDGDRRLLVLANCSSTRSRPIADDLPALAGAEVLLATHPGRTGLDLAPWESRVYALRS